MSAPQGDNTTAKSAVRTAAPASASASASGSASSSDLTAAAAAAAAPPKPRHPVNNATAASAPKLNSAASASARSTAAAAKPKAATAAASAVSSKPPRSHGAGSAPLRHKPPLSSRRAAGGAGAGADSAAPPSRPRSVVHRSVQVGSIVIRVLESDIASIPVSAVVNAANSLSFTPMDGGISGALRRAMGPNCTGHKKQWWDDEGAQHSDIKLPVTQAGVQAATGPLLARGVQHVIHAVGPTWTDFAIAESTFKRVMPLIRRTVRRALNAASRVHATSVAVPAISGGIFTHYRADDPEVKNREQRAARRAVLEAVLDWAMQQAQSKETSSIDTVLLCDLSKKELGAVHVFVEEFDAVIADRKQKLDAVAEASPDAAAYAHQAQVPAAAAPADAASSLAAEPHQLAPASSSTSVDSTVSSTAPDVCPSTAPINEAGSSSESASSVAAASGPSPAEL